MLKVKFRDGLRRMLCAALVSAVTIGCIEEKKQTFAEDRGTDAAQDTNSAADTSTGSDQLSTDSHVDAGVDAGVETDSASDSDRDTEPQYAACEEGYAFVDDNLAALLADYDLETITEFSTTAGYDFIVESLEGLQCLTTLESLEMYYHEFTVIDPLAALSNLSLLSLAAPFTDLAPLSDLTELRELSLLGLFDDLAPISNLTDLKSLSLHGEFTDINALSPLTELLVLDVSENGTLSDISPIFDASKLEFLNISGNDISDISVLGGMPELSELHLTDNRIAEIAPLGEVSGLERVYFSDNLVSDLGPLSSHTGLMILRMLRNEVTDVSPLSSLTALTSLEAGENDITDVGPLSTLSSLTRLDLRRNSVTALDGLAPLTALTQLNLESNAVEDLQPLSGLSNVTVLRLARNPISDLSGLEGMTGLELLYLNSCDIRDLAPLVNNPGIGEGDRISLADNPHLCESEAVVDQLTALIARGVFIDHPCTLPQDTDSEATLEDAGDDAGDIDTDTTVDPWPETEPETVTNISVLLDPYGTAPLSAVIVAGDSEVTPDTINRVEITVVGRGEPQEDLTAELYPQTDQFRINFDMSDILPEGAVGIPVLGLYPGGDNEVRFRFTDGERVFTGSAIISVSGDVTAADETAIVSVSDPERMEPGFTYLNDRVYDQFGNLRWTGPKIYRILRNGNYLTNLHEINWLGKTVVKRSLPSNLASHKHDNIELPNGNIVIAVNNKETEIINAAGLTVTSIEDYIIEMDANGSVVNAWDLRDYLDVSRGTVVFRNTDWVHVNTLAYDETDDTILVSGRYQGIIKLTRNGEQGETPNVGKDLVWIFGPNLGWEYSGWNGEGDIDTSLYLLSAVDSEGVSFPWEVQANLAAPDPGGDNFYWPVGQHGIAMTSRTDGKLSFLTFNNQASFIFDGEDTLNNGVTFSTQGDLTNDRSLEPYSQIAEYEIDENTMTVRQLWGFGENQPELYGSRNCGVNLLPQTQNRMMISNGGDQHDPDGENLDAHVIEIADLNDVVFHLEIPDAGISAYRAGRIDLYHPKGAN